MLELKIALEESYDESTNRFVITEAKAIKLEYSLLALSKWESKWETHFINNKNLSQQQYMDFIQCMVVDGDFNIEELKQEHFDVIEAYINRPSTATKVIAKQKKGNKKMSYMTSEVYYAMMSQANVPYECDKWNINRLTKVLEVISSFTNGEEKQKRNVDAQLLQNAELNAARRAKYNTKG